MKHFLKVASATILAMKHTDVKIEFVKSFLPDSAFGVNRNTPVVGVGTLTSDLPLVVGDLVVLSDDEMYVVHEVVSPIKTKVINAEPQDVIGKPYIWIDSAVFTAPPPERKPEPPAIIVP